MRASSSFCWTGDVALDLGCGTATLTILAKQQHPFAHVVGVDGDAKILKFALNKVRRLDLEVPLQRAMAFELQAASAIRALARVARERELHVADWDKPHNTAMWLVSRRRTIV